MRAWITGLPLMAALVACSSSADTITQDLRCYVAASAGHAAGPSDQDIALLTAYYLGRLEATDPGGGWAETAIETMNELKADPSQFADLSQSCVARMQASIQRQRTAAQRR